MDSDFVQAQRASIGKVTNVFNYIKQLLSKQFIGYQPNWLKDQLKQRKP